MPHSRDFLADWQTLEGTGWALEQGQTVGLCAVSRAVGHLGSGGPLFRRRMNPLDGERPVSALAKLLGLGMNACPDGRGAIPR